MRNRESIHILWLCNKPEQKILSNHGAILILVLPRTWKRSLVNPYDLRTGSGRNWSKSCIFSWFFMVFRDFSWFFVFFSLTDFIWTVLRFYLELEVEIETGNRLGLEVLLFAREHRKHFRSRKNRPKKIRPKKKLAEKKSVEKISRLF